jgi:hypothetical protein
VTLDDLGNIGEFVGAVAVLVTLIYLAAQIRQNSATTRAQIRQALAEEQVRYINIRATDPFIRRVLGKMFARQELDDDEAFGLTAHVVAGIRMFENYYAQYCFGTMDREDWRAIREVIKMHFQYPAYRDGFAFIEASWNVRFADEIKSIIREIDGPIV